MGLACAYQPAEGMVVLLLSLSRPCSHPLGAPPPHQLPAVPARGRRPAPPVCPSSQALLCSPYLATVLLWGAGRG